MNELTVLASIGVAWLAGYGARWAQERGPVKRRGSRLVFNFAPPATLARMSTPEVCRANDTRLISFALNCSLMPTASERAVVAAGIVSGPSDYRAYKTLMLQVGLWQQGQRRSRVRWIEDRGGAVKRFRRLLRMGRIHPRYSPTLLPPVNPIKRGRGVLQTS